MGENTKTRRVPTDLIAAANEAAQAYNNQQVEIENLEIRLAEIQARLRAARDEQRPDKELLEGLVSDDKLTALFELMQGWVLLIEHGTGPQGTDKRIRILMKEKRH